MVRQTHREIARLHAMDRDRRADPGNKLAAVRRALPADVQERLDRAEARYFTAWFSAMTGGDEGLPREPRKREQAVKKLLYE
jgi:hypothetical protein